jgi:Cu(I)/Ag(I) efflux system membrane fusion protein
VGQPGLVSRDAGGGQTVPDDHAGHAGSSTQEEARAGIIRIDPRRWQTIGVRTGAVERRPLQLEVRAVGKVTYDETRLSEVSVKYAGWIGRLDVDSPGQQVRKGQTLFTLYSPELYAAQQELLTALASQRAAEGGSAPDRADYLVRASRERLRLWELTPGQIDRLATTGQAVERLPIVSPASGHVVEKNVVAGSAVEPGMRLYRIAGLDRVWVEAEVYESELPLVEEGQPAVVTLPSMPGTELRGEVAFVYPYLDGAARTGKVRVELANPGLKLKPDMFANVLLTRDLGERLAVPEGAVLYAGPKSYVFLDLGEGRLRPQRVETGREVDGWVEVLSGLSEGDVIVTSGNFLIAAESRLKVALDQWQ